MTATQPCAWCDDPAPAGSMLCATCDAANSGPVFHCDIALHRVWAPAGMMGTSCHYCDREAAAKAERSARNAPLIALYRREIESLRTERWAPGFDWCRAIAVRVCLGLIAELEQ